MSLDVGFSLHPMQLRWELEQYFSQVEHVTLAEQQKLQLSPEEKDGRTVIDLEVECTAWSDREIVLVSLIVLLCTCCCLLPLLSLPFLRKREPPVKPVPDDHMRLECNLEALGKKLQSQAHHWSTGDEPRELHAKPKLAPDEVVTIAEKAIFGLVDHKQGAIDRHQKLVDRHQELVDRHQELVYREKELQTKLCELEDKLEQEASQHQSALNQLKVELEHANLEFEQASRQLEAARERLAALEDIPTSVVNGLQEQLARVTQGHGAILQRLRQWSPGEGIFVEQLMHISLEHQAVLYHLDQRMVERRHDQEALLSYLLNQIEVLEGRTQRVLRRGALPDEMRAPPEVGASQLAPD